MLWEKFIRARFVGDSDDAAGATLTMATWAGLLHNISVIYVERERASEGEWEFVSESGELLKAESKERAVQATAGAQRSSRLWTVMRYVSFGCDWRTMVADLSSRYYFTCSPYSSPSSSDSHASRRAGRTVRWWMYRLSSACRGARSPSSPCQLVSVVFLFFHKLHLRCFSQIYVTVLVSPADCE